MTKYWPIVTLALAACGSQPQANTAIANTAVNQAETAAAPKAANCDMPKLDFGAANLDAGAQAAYTANFRPAFDRACREGLFADGPLVDPQALDPSTLFVLSAPEANVTSVYFTPAEAPTRMMIESPFGSPPQIPSADDFHEAIFCAVHGATTKEDVEGGRCLPD